MARGVGGFPRIAGMKRPAYGLLVGVAVLMGVVALVVSHALDERLRDPDGFLWELWSRAPDKMGAIIHDLHAEAERRAGAPVSLKALLKRNRLNRLAPATIQ